ncbi:bacterial translation initiation factor 2 (bIF-2) [Desulfocicer vacuolatum DSM 3385]|uniref:Translation initiation factor IF-2 n=1 Tax=Desulfocicer vacuolatum DSM 3385 TaxID=1121400 RepID=A0A1W1ZW25_9BACT|nr:translation initiation factor IF-2 [Desulfocicer vacuolatum]SMC52268.1 bacterial translation initiation factor 2 (bIF-2) [Desulfocicer vacuolatum DSM 3385]
MAKIRVYELAKKLNLTNRALLTKLKALDIEVKSHMSSLEDEDVNKVKKSMFGQKNKRAETRVKPSVIRRRKPVKQKKPAESPSKKQDLDPVPSRKPSSQKDDDQKSAAAKDSSLEKNTVGTGVDDIAADNGSPKDLPGETVAPVDEKKDEKTDNHAQESMKTDVSPKKADALLKPAKPKKKGNAARIISIPTKEKPAKIVEPVAPEKETPSEPPVPEKEIAPESPVSETVADASAKGEEPVQTDSKEASLTKDTPPVPKDASSVKKEMDDENEKLKNDIKEEDGALDKVDTDNDTVGEAPVDDSDAAGKKRPRKKKVKKSEPAKIIKLAVPPVIPPARKKAGTPSGADLPRHRRKPGKPSAPRPSAPPRNVKVQAPPVSPREMPGGDLSGKARSKKDKRKKWEQTDGSPGTPGKGNTRKKRSVVEGKDLYDGRRGGKKGRRKDNRNKQRGKVQKTQITTPKAIKRRVKIDDTIELAELAKRMGIKANEMIVKLMGMGVMATVNQTIDYDTATLVAAEFDYEVEKASFEEDLLMDTHVEENPEDLISRSPVVTIMGHVDHGKTSLLDVIRKSKITTGEAGGITQHIGAYSVETPKGVITFLDTPGHAAFTAMRSRGAQVTDLVVLVVAADDGVMPQTIEAINHSKAANVPVIVAVNKMDKPDADPDRVMRELSEHGLVSEDWGGDVIFARVSAKAETGIDELLEMILLQAEVLELKANPTRHAMGHVVEARLDAGRGPVATVLVEQGTLRAGEPLVCGLHSGKIRIMIGDIGQTVTEAGPSTPVEIVGLSGVPEAGDEFVALSSEKDAKQISEHRMQKERAKELAKKSRANLEKLFANMGSDEIKELKLIIKADVHGSLEALNDSVMKLAQEEVDIKIVHSGTGAINESDVSLAAVSDAIIIGFNVRPTPKVRELAKEENIDMRFYDIIYNVINDIKAALTGLMPSTFHENILGRAEVRDTFVIPNKGTVAGSFVLDGKVSRGDKIRLLRDGVVKCKSTVASLRRFKDDVKEVAQGYECGIGLEKFNDIKTGDIFECYDIEERKATLEQIK